MWYLTVIFVSVSINLELIKIFPQVLADFSLVIDDIARDKRLENSTDKEQSISDANDNRFEHIEYIASQTMRQRSSFILACRDFYHRLSDEQQVMFRKTFTAIDEAEITEMLNSL